MFSSVCSNKWIKTGEALLKPTYLNKDHVQLPNVHLFFLKRKKK